MSVRNSLAGGLSTTTGETMNITECTVVLLGDSGVGKTALLNRFVFNTFRQVIVFTKIIDLATHPIIII